ncbi:MAG: DNA polymerase III subunit gamma/tau [Oscillospiraceae bacterium]|nr:DNA polymerase III subunit gamma/tau [Oscillospiraceae bacterium]
MAYQALYRQWRPARFADFVGQEAVIAILRGQVVSGRVAHAYLFCGSRGTGKTSAAKVMARAINCARPVDGEPCGECQVCRKLGEENSLDVVEIDAASNNGVDEVRDLRERVKYPPQYGAYRVYIVDEVHMLSAGAFNALLKTLEEPPAHAVFILATTEPQRLPATIVSRCQRYDFHRLPADQIAARLGQAAQGAAMHASPDALDRIARAADGGMRDALSMLDMCISYAQSVRANALDDALVRDVLGAADRDFLFDFADALLAADAAAALVAVDELMRQGREAQVFARDVAWHLRALLLAQTCGARLADLLESTREDAARYTRQAEGVAPARLLSMLDVFLTADTEMKWASQPRLALEMAAARVCLAAQVAGPAEAKGNPPAQPGAGSANGGPAPVQPLPQAASPRERAPAKAPPEKVEGDAPAQPGGGPAADGLAAPPRATVASAPARGADAAHSAADWGKVAEILKRTHPASFAQLLTARFGGRDGHDCLVYFPPGQPGKVKDLLDDYWRAPIEAALREAFADEEAAFRPLLDTPAASPTAQHEAKRVQERAFQLFGRENVQVVED